MGSLPSQPLPATPPPSPQNSAAGYRIYASFCLKEPSPNTNISNWVECFNPLTNTWTYVSTIPGLIANHVLKGFAMVSIGYSIYIIGGRLCHKKRAHASESSDDFVEVDVEVLSTVLRYDVRTEQWSNCTPLGIPRYDFACTVCDNKIYVAGGQSTLGSARGISSAEVYDPVQDEWTLLPNMTILRYKCAGVTWQGKIHVVGGFVARGESDSPGSSPTERSSADVFDTGTETWDLMAKMWQLDVPPHQIVAVDGRLFSCGDCLNIWKGHIEYYDDELNMWNIVDGSSHLRSLYGRENSPPIERLYLTMAPIGTQLYFLAGYRMAGEFSRTVSMVHRFDTTAARDEWAWRSFEPMEEGRGEKELCSHCCVVQLS